MIESEASAEALSLNDTGALPGGGDAETVHRNRSQPAGQAATPVDARQRISLGYMPAVEGLRALAVASVLLFHLDSSILPGGFVGVDIFFVISGFVVTGSLIDARFDRARDMLLYFYARRILRIGPALAAMLITTSFLYCLFVPDAWLSQTAYEVGRSAFFGVSNIVLALETDTYFSPRSEFNPFVHTWSLGVEEQFYLVFPFLIYWHQSRHRQEGPDRLALWVIGSLILASLALSAVLTTSASRLAFYTMPPRFWELAAGIVLCLTAGTWRPRLSAASPLAKQAAVLIGAGLIAIAFGPYTNAAFPFPMALLPVAGTIVIIALVGANSGGGLQTLLASRPAVLVGKRSYSLYLWHFPVFALLRWTLGLQQWPLAALALALTVVLAECSYRFVERPFRDHSRISGRNYGLVVAIGLALLAAGSAATVAMMKAKTHLSLSRTADKYVWYAEDTRALSPNLSRCDLTATTGEVTGGTLSIWVPVRCTMARPQSRLFVIGDSHALAYNPMLRQFAASKGVELRSYFATGCPFIDLQQTMASRAECTTYYSAALDQLAGELRPNDILFLPSLRLPRMIDQWGAKQVIADGAGPSPPVTAEARLIMARLSATGARIVLEAPLPIFRSPSFRCADWFNRGNPVCKDGPTMSTAYLQAMRRPVVESEQRVAAEYPRTSVWDPFPTLCGRDTCSAITAKGPVFFDGDHLTGFGNDRLYESFDRYMSRFVQPGT